MFLSLYNIKGFYETNHFYRAIFFNLDKFYMNSTMTGITLASANAKPPLHFDQNISECLMLNDFLPNSVQWCLLYSFLIILFMELNFLIYFKKVKTNKTKIRYSKTNIMRKLILISIYKILLAGIIFFALKNPATKPKQFSVDESRLSKQAYFLSPEYYRDIYKINEQYTKHLLKWQCLSKLKLNSFEKFYQTLLLLSGDIALNPGPVSYPCSKCSKGIRTSAVLCTNCEMWIHGKCEGISNTAIKSLSNDPTLRSHFVCVVCRNKNNNLDLTEDDQIVAESSFQFQEEHVHDISLDDYSSIFKQKGLHFIHLNCNSLLSKIEELRTFIVSTSPHIICFSETKLDKSISDREIAIENYSCVRKDRNRNGGGVACFIHKSIAFEVRSDFSDEFENVFIDILLPKTKPILLGVAYRPPSDMQFVENLANGISNSNSFDAQEVILLGDFNVNLLDRKNKLIHKKGYRFSKEDNYSTPIHLTKNYNQLLKSNGLTQLINEPTRKTDATESLLDHILVNTPDKISQSGVIEKGISDHEIIFCTRKHQKFKSGQHNSIKIRSMKKYSKELFLEKLNEVEFPEYSNFQHVNEAYSDIITKLMVVIDNIAPIKEIRVKGNSKSWFDGDISERINVRDKLKKKYKKTGLQVDYENFKNTQNQVKKLIKSKKCDFVKGQLKANIAKPSKLWKVLKSLGLSSKDSNNSKVCLKENGISYFEPKETSGIFRKFYKNLAQTLVDKLPASPKIYTMDSTKHYYEQFDIQNNLNLEMIDHTVILDLLSKINISKAAGIDKLSGIFIKDGAEIIAFHFTKIINLSILSSSFPDPCKIAKLIALFKKGSRTEAKNYRPISLLPLFSKIFEKVVHIQTEKFLNDNKILFANQSGFRPRHSTETCLTHLTDSILEGSDKGLHTGMILIDLQKAFDTINYKILLEKMVFLKFSPPTIAWFRSYLTNRNFVVDVDSTLSEPAELVCGVPQGSILGPLLFLIYINDLPQSVRYSDIRLYADDTCISFKHRNINLINDKLNQDFNSLCDWFLDNKLSIHFGEDKTKTILFSPKNLSKGAEPLIVKRNDVTLKQFSSVEYLGCLLDSTLSGEEMAVKVLTKVNGRLRFLYRQGKYLNKRLRRMLCNTIIQPHFDYASSAWYPNLGKGLKKKLQIAQNKCVRYCLYLGNREGIRYRHFKEINWLPISERVDQFIAVSVYKFSKGLAPIYMEDVFKNNSSLRRTRYSNESKLSIPSRNHNYGKNCISYRGATIWNSLEISIKEAQSCNSFKHLVKDRFFRNLKQREENVYVY